MGKTENQKNDTELKNGSETRITSRIFKDLEIALARHEEMEIRDMLSKRGKK